MRKESWEINFMYGQAKIGTNLFKFLRNEF